ncbi:MAG TPA: class I SAM-dependent methyltransferase [Longimicrobium sp.]
MTIGQRRGMDEEKRWVAEGYERAAERHAEWAAHVRVAERAEYTERVADAFPAGASVLELGCGAGGPTTQRLASRYRLVAVDLAWRNLELARLHAPSAAFVQADMGELAFRPASFDAVAAFYSIIHLPRAQHGALLASVAEWLKPGGLFVASFGTRDAERSIDDDWLGVRMFSSSHPPDTTLHLVADAGLRTLDARVRTEDEDGRPISFLWVVAERETLARSAGVS